MLDLRKPARKSSKVQVVVTININTVFDVWMDEDDRSLD